MRVLLADDRTQVCLALKRLLEQEPELSVVGEASEAKDLLARVQETRPDLVLIDWELPGLRAADLLPALRAICCPMMVVALSGHKEMRQKALAAGANAFVSKEEPLNRLLTILRTVGGLSPYFAG